MRRYRKKGFSIVEVLLTIAILGVFLEISLSSFVSFRSENDFRFSSLRIVDALRSAQARSRHVENDSVWGVRINADAVIVFQGENFSTRDTRFDSVTDLSGIVGVNGQTEFLFEKVSGFPRTSGGVVLLGNSVQYSFTVNGKGSILYQ